MVSAKDGGRDALSLIDEFDRYLGNGRTLYTKARGTKFTAFVRASTLIVESERSGRKSFDAATVATAARAVAEGAPPLEDRAAQFARSWVSAIQDAMAGTPNAPKRATVAKPAKPVKRGGKASVAKRPTATSSRKAGQTGRSTRAPRAARASRPTGTARPPVVSHAGADPSEIAIRIGEEIAKALGQLRSQPDERDARSISQITDQLTALTAQVEELRAERDALATQLEASEKQLRAWKAAASSVAGLGTAALAPLPKATSAKIPEGVADLLMQAARTWKTAPSGSVSASRSALELVVRHVAGAVSGTAQFDTAAFAPVHQFLMSRLGAKATLPDSDLHLARDLYRRSSKSSHNEEGWRPSSLDALLVWTGVAALAERAFGASA